MADSRRIATVSQINNYIKALMEQVPVLGNVWIKGEISNFKRHSSGHLYLTLKDSGSVLKAVMFRAAAYNLSFKPEDGMKVLARGRISVYEAGGQYQLYIEEMEAEGQGDLYAKFEALKKKLAEEGLFDEERKKALPRFPQTIGIVTSPTGAAVRDMINVLRRRYPMVKVVLYPCLVQGETAAESVSQAIEYFNKEKNVDVIIAGRGGGSIEDLWAFNEERTARAVANSEIPIISAVGHETDFTICDFAASLRAPTPSAAAELAVPDFMELRRFADTAQSRMGYLLKKQLEAKTRELKLLCERSSITKFDRALMDRQQTLDSLYDRCEKSISDTIEASDLKVKALCGKLSVLSPLSVFERGYCAAIHNGKTLQSAADVEVGDLITLKMCGGEVDCNVNERRLSDEI